MTTLLAFLFACSTTDDSAGKDTSGTTDTSSDYTSQQFADDGIAALCDVYLECLDAATLAAMGITDKQSCIDTYGEDITDTGGSACDFQPDKAEACVAAWQTMTCEEFMDETSTKDDVCDEVCAE